MLITIVTVCYNAEHCIEKTMQSVLSQTYPDIEYIIKDGSSTDRTNEIIEQYREKFQQRGIKFEHIIQKDKGIYDAMNQATKEASGEYIIYMNADDIFFDGTVLSCIFDGKKSSEDVVYGDAVCEYEFVKGRKEYTLWQGQHQCFITMPISHQACFIKTETIKHCYYDTKYKIAADFDLIVKLFKSGKTFKNAHCIVSLCTMDGISHTNCVASYNEAIQVRKELGREEYLKGDNSFNIWLMKVKQWIMDSLPYWFVGRLLRFQMNRKGTRIFASLEALLSVYEGDLI